MMSRQADRGGRPESAHAWVGSVGGFLVVGMGGFRLRLKRDETSAKYGYYSCGEAARGTRTWLRRRRNHKKGAAAPRPRAATANNLILFMLCLCSCVSYVSFCCFWWKTCKANAKLKHDKPKS